MGRRHAINARIPFQSFVEVFEVEKFGLLLRLDTFHQKVDHFVKLFRRHVARGSEMVTEC